MDMLIRPSDGPARPLGHCRRQLALLPWVIFFVLLATAVAAQQREIRFDRIEQGLSQGTVNSILQDSRGLMWFGTQDGLNRFDGYSMEVYKHHPEDKASLPSNHIWSLREDERGDVWIGTEGGPVRWVRRLNRFERLRRGEAADLGVKTRDVWRHGEVVWIADDGQGLSRLDLASGAVQQLRHDAAREGGLASDQVLTFLPQPQAGILWIGTTAGLHRLDLDTERLEHIALDAVAEEGAQRIRDIEEDTQGRLWLATYSGLVRFDPRSDEALRWRADDEAPGALSSDILRALLLDQQGYLWVGTEEGLQVFEPARKPSELTFAHYRAEATDPARLANPRVFSLFQDRGGVLWVGTQSGLHKWHPSRWAFGHYRHDPHNPNSLASNAVTSFSEGPDGNLWIGTLGGGLDRWDREAGVFLHHRPEDRRGLDDRRIMALLHDQRGTLWVGTYRSGLFRLDETTDRFVGFRHDPKDPKSLSANAISVLFEDASRRLWVGTFGGGLNRFDPDTGQAERFQASSEPGRSLSSNNITGLAENADGLWVATTDGLDLLDPRRGNVAHFELEVGRPGRMPIMSLHVDSQGTLWVGTKDAGLARLIEHDPVSGQVDFSFLTESDGLPNGVIYGIYNGAPNQLWVSTNNGLSRIDFDAPGGERFTNYDRSHGLQQNEFNFGAHHQSASGELFFGGFNGFNVFHPEKLPINGQAPPLVLTAIKKLNQPVDLEVPLEDLRQLTLDHRDSMISFEFAALDYAAPEHNRYAHKLEGFDRDWIELGDARLVTYTNLNPGKYTLRVKAANGDGVWNEEGLSLPIHVKPAPWRTWWAYTLYLLVLSGSLLAAVRMRIEGLKRNERRLESMVEQRTTELESAVKRLEISEQGAQRARQEAEEANRAKSIFLSSMSHELRTPLNAVIGFSQLLRRERGLRESHRKHLNIILRSGEHLLGLINDVLSLSKIEAGESTLNPLPFNIRRTISGVIGMIQIRAERAGVQLAVSPWKDFPEVVEGDEKKLRQVLLNLLSNAVKFTPQGGQVTLRGRWLHGVAFFDVEDTGAGIAPEEQQSLFRPFTQTEAGRQAQEGTGLGLTISRDFVRLMGGDISLSSEVGVGSRFSFHVLLPAAEAGEALVAGPNRSIAALAPGQPKFRVVVADDKEENRWLLMELLSSVGFEVREAANGEQAFDLWRSWRPHVIWTDLRMPGQSGQELIVAVRQAEAAEPTLRRTVVLVLTATVLERDRQEMLDLGADDFLVKPFAEEQIFEALETHLGARFLTHELSAMAPAVGVGGLSDLQIQEIPTAIRQKLHGALIIGDLDLAGEIVSQSHLGKEIRELLEQKLANYDIEPLIERLAEGPTQ